MENECDRANLKSRKYDPSISLHSTSKRASREPPSKSTLTVLVGLQTGSQQGH